MMRSRRRVLQPEDVGLPRGRRRRTPGLRREEAAALSSMSTAYYGRLERRCGPRPSPVMLAAIARGLRFSRDDRDRLFAAVGHDTTRHLGVAHVEPGVMHILSRLADTPALALDRLGVTLHQTLSATALFGDTTGQIGWARSGYHRWFTAPADRRYHPDEHAVIGAEIVTDLSRALESRQYARAATGLVRQLLARSDEFAGLWRRRNSLHVSYAARCVRLVRPGLGVIELQREVFLDADDDQRIVVFLAAPGSESDTKLRLSSVVGQHRFPE